MLIKLSAVIQNFTAIFLKGPFLPRPFKPLFETEREVRLRNKKAEAKRVRKATKRKVYK